MTYQARSEDGTPLAGLRVLVVEDDYFIAHEICTMLRNHGAEVLGPSPSVEHSLALIRDQPLDCAVLDVNLHGQLSFKLARELQQRGTPSIFATGYDSSVFPSGFQDSVRLEKPVDLQALLQAVRTACETSKPPNVESVK